MSNALIHIPPPEPEKPAETTPKEEAVQPYTFEERKKILEENFRKLDQDNMPRVW